MTRTVTNAASYKGRTVLARLMPRGHCLPITWNHPGLAEQYAAHAREDGLKCRAIEDAGKYLIVIEGVER